MNIPVSVPDNLKQLVIDGANLPETLSLDQVRELAMAFASVALSKDALVVPGSIGSVVSEPRPLTWTRIFSA